MVFLLKSGEMLPNTYMRCLPTNNQRTKIFFLIGAINLTSVVVIPPISGLIMNRFGALSTYSITIPLLVISTFILALVPRQICAEQTPEQAQEPELSVSSHSEHRPIHRI